MMARKQIQLRYLLFSAIGLVCIFVVVLICENFLIFEIRQKSPQDICVDNGWRLVSGIRKFIYLHGRAPDTIEELLAEGLIEAPINPYSNEPVKAIQLTMKPAIGNVVYFPAEQVVLRNSGQTVTHRGFWIMVIGEQSPSPQIDRDAVVELFGNRGSAIVFSEGSVGTISGQYSGDIAGVVNPDYSEILERNGYAFDEQQGYVFEWEASEGSSI